MVEFPRGAGDENVSPVVRPKFSFTGNSFGLTPSYKRYAIYPQPYRGVDFYVSNVSQPRSSCGNCFPVPQAGDRSDYVDLFEFPMFGGRPYPLVPGAEPPSRFAAELRYTWNTPIPHKYPAVRDDVLTSDRVVSIVEKLSEERERPLSAMRRRATVFFFEIRANLNRFVCRICGYVLFKIFQRLMRRLLVNPQQMDAVKEAEKTGIPLVYLPLHRSHMDYLLITWCNWHFGLRLPHIASGDNLNLSGFGWLLRATGAFFIRRRLDASDQAGKDVLYRTVLRSYIEEVLQKGMSIEFFLEGTRSRFGKALLPKNGLISNVVEAVQQGVIPDVYLVPVSYTYDQVAEGVFLNELMGTPKIRESIFGVFKGLWNGLGQSKRCGTVRMHYGKPVLLTDYLTSLSAAVKRQAQADSLQSKQLSRMPQSFSYRELVPWTQDSIEHNRALIRAIGHHVVYEAQEICSVSPVAVVSALLLGKYRHGASLDQLAADVQWLCEMILRHGGDVVGWRSEETSPYTFVEYALQFLRDSIRLSSDDGRIELITTHRQLIHLAYSKNALVHRFAIRSAIALSVCSHSPDTPMTVKSVVDKTLQICDWLQTEVIFCKPCESLRGRVSEMLGRSDMSSKFTGMLCLERVEDEPCDEDTLEVASGQHADMLMFYSNLLRPFLQTLYLVLYRLHTMGPDLVRENDFVRETIKACLATPPSELPFELMLECVNSDSVRNSLRVLRDKEIISTEGTPVTVLQAKTVEQATNDIAQLLDIC